MPYQPKHRFTLLIDGVYGSPTDKINQALKKLNQMHIGKILHFKTQLFMFEYRYGGFYLWDWFARKGPLVYDRKNDSGRWARIS